MKGVSKVAYTLEFKLEALRRMRSGETVRKIARGIGVPEQSTSSSEFPNGRGGSARLARFRVLKPHIASPPSCNRGAGPRRCELRNALRRLQCQPFCACSRSTEEVWK